MQARREFVIGIGVFLVAIWVYYPALGVRQVADDFRIVERLSFDDARHALHQTVGYGRNEYRPLIAFSFALSNAFWRGKLRGYHLESILFHAMNVALLFWWLFLLTKSPTISGMAAILFAVHPIHHARVVWIAARDSLPSTLFLLAALIAYTLARRRNESTGARRSSAARILISLSLMFFVLSLLCYEGAVVLPGILAGMEFFLFAKQAQGAREKLRAAAIHTSPFLIVLGIYLAWWGLLFRGEIGQYELALGIGSLSMNYYRMLYQLFHGNAHLAGLLYFSIALLGLFLPRERQLLLWFAIALMLIAYLPFVMIAGFASRFAYVSAIGYTFLIALLLSGCTFHGKTMRMPALRYIPLPVAVGIFFVLVGYYTIDLRARIADWKTAGEIAELIPCQIKIRYPDLPDGSTLVLSRIPRMHGHAYVYPLGLKAAIERFYAGRRLQVHYGPGEISDIVVGKDLRSPKLIFFQFNPDRSNMEEISTPSRQHRLR